MQNGLLNSPGDRDRTRQLLRFMRDDARKTLARADQSIDPIAWLEACGNIELLRTLCEALLNEQLADAAA